MKTLLTLLVLLFSSSVLADDISDFQIEGMSIGDSLLDYLSEKEIKKEININRKHYKYLSDKFGEVYLHINSEKYDDFSVFVETANSEYIVYAIYGTNYIDDYNVCKKEAKIILNEIESILNYDSKHEGTISHHKYPNDSRVKVYGISLYMSEDPNNSEGISIQCYEFADYIDPNNLSISIQTDDIINWFDN